MKSDKDPNSDWMRVDERTFIQEFIEFYCTSILDTPEEFHYESFYDYYHEYLENHNYPADLAQFFRNFIQKYNLEKQPSDLLFDFNMSYNQLIAHLLEKRFERCHLAKPYHPSCDRFLNLIESLSGQFIVDFHSLNHDLYLEYLAYSDSMHANLDDGFEEFGSPYYGKLLAQNERYMVRLARFTNKYVQPFRLYKLHGGIDRYWYESKDGTELIRLKWGLGKTDVLKEVIENGEYKYDFRPLSYYPDFLSGTTYKTRQYSKGDYYPTIFKHLEENLKSSNFLISIGYGFGDRVINEYITDSFLTSSVKMLFIVDIKQPLTDLLKQENVFYIGGGVVGMDTQFILKQIGV